MSKELQLKLSDLRKLASELTSIAAKERGHKSKDFLKREYKLIKDIIPGDYKYGSFEIIIPLKKEKYLVVEKYSSYKINFMGKRILETESFKEIIGGLKVLKEYHA